MKIISTVMLCLCFLSMNSFAGNDELVPRKGLSPLDRAKVNQVQAQRWSRTGMSMEIGEDAQGNVSQYGNSLGVGSVNSGRTRNCSTNIGNVTTQKGVSSGRYGPKNKNSNVVVVKGDVINVCN